VKSGQRAALFEGIPLAFGFLVEAFEETRSGAANCKRGKEKKNGRGAQEGRRLGDLPPVPVDVFENAEPAPNPEFGCWLFVPNPPKEPPPNPDIVSDQFTGRNPLEYQGVQP